VESYTNFTLLLGRIEVLSQNGNDRGTLPSRLPAYLPQCLHHVRDLSSIQRDVQPFKPVCCMCVASAVCVRQRAASTVCFRKTLKVFVGYGVCMCVCIRVWMCSYVSMRVHTRCEVVTLTASTQV